MQEKYLKHAPKGKFYSHNYKGRKIVFSDPQAFLLSVNELFIEGIYTFKSENAQPIILDCGAHIGMSVLFFKTLFPKASIIAFEPDSHNYKLAKENIESWHFDDVQVLKKAVWINNNPIYFNQTSDMGSSIVITKGDNQDKLVEVECIRLKEYLQQKVDFFKARYRRCRIRCY